jgi:hypothetical protein
VKVNADDVGQQQVNGLAEHRRLGLDPANTPSDHPEAVDHGGVRVGADQCVGIQVAVLLQDAAREKLEVHLVANAKARRDDSQAGKGLRAPLEESVPFMVAAELRLRVEAQRIAAPEVIDLHGVIDHEIYGDRRLY